jgi:hypothetical protein
MNDPRTFKDILDIFTNLASIVTPLVASLALLVFFWGLAKFIFNLSGDSKAVAEGKNLMIWGTIALFVMVSIWGIIRFFSGEFGFGDIGVPLLPGRS